MWRRLYLLLVVVRLYLALSPSYLHPDENFQGPEIIAHRIFDFPASPTWEFTSSQPIRSVFPLWLVYGAPMYLVRWLWQGFHHDEPPAWLLFYILRGYMFMLSFVLEDWALHELVSVSRQRRLAITLVASSYVTCTWQTHTFSNSMETLLVLWTLVLVGRIVGEKKRSQLLGTSVLASLLVLGFFNRITFPAFVIVPILQMIPHLQRKPWSLVVMILVGALTTVLAILIDTNFYQPMSFDFYTLLQKPTITPANNIIYNSSSSNLAQHGLHPFYQHVLINLPQFLGPAFPLLFFSARRTNRLYSAAAGCLLLSFIPHQEARFLLPAVPLFLSSIRLPRWQTRTWIGVWLTFNIVLGTLMGVYHQGGVIPAQSYIGSEQISQDVGQIRAAVWWKTYWPPTWLLGDKDNGHMSEIIALSGAKPGTVSSTLLDIVPCQNTGDDQLHTLLVAPRSANIPVSKDLEFQEVWSYSRHINLDDIDWAEDGIWGTLARVVGRSGLVIWDVQRVC
ncbi:MAG: alpha 1,2 mannosyltransferase [Bogoriella megaspora]|nr:MAG: alpha 1,2 mannosyltransferase [Bogoriella megaspora]